MIELCYSAGLLTRIRSADLLADRHDYFPVSLSIVPGHCFLRHWANL